jgi:intracellular septation protein A
MGKEKLFVALDFLVNLGGPWLVYRLVEGSTSITGALILSSVPPIIWSLWQLVHNRKLDVISVLVIAGIAASLAATMLGGNPRLLLVRESFITGVFGLVFLGSLWFPRPLMFYIVQATIAKQGIAEDQFAAKWSVPGFRQTFYLMTAVWGVGLIAQNGAANHPGICSVDRTGPGGLSNRELRILFRSFRVVVLVWEKAEETRGAIGGGENKSPMKGDPGCRKIRALPSPRVQDRDDFGFGKVA